MKELINKYLTQRNRNIIAIVVIILGIGFIINYSFFEPTYINEYIATKVYDAPANSYFDDENFYNCVVDAYNSKNGTSHPYTTNLSDEDLQTIVELSCRGDGSKTDDEKIVSTNGLEKLTNLEEIDFSHNKITEIDLEGLLFLKTFISYSNNISNIDITKNVNLVDFRLTNGSVTEIDVSENKLLEYLNLDHNLIENIHLSNNIKLKSLSIRYNDLVEIDISKNTDLVYLNLGNSEALQKLDLSSNLNLESLYLYGTGQMKELDLSNNINLKTLSIQGSSSITSLDLKSNLHLSDVIFQSTNLNKLDLSDLSVKSAYIAFNANLDELNFSDTELSNLHLNSWPGQSVLSKLDVSNCNLKSLNISSETALKKLYVSNNQLTNLDVSNNTELVELYAYNNKLSSLDLNSNTKLEYLNAYNNPINSVGLSKCTNLKYLTLGNNTNEIDKTLDSLDLSNNTDLLGLSLTGNSISELNLSYLSKLKILCLGGSVCKWTSSSSSIVGSTDGNNLKKLDLSNNINLTNLYVSNNKLNDLIINKNVSLTKLEVNNNQLTELDVSNNKLLSVLDVKNNQLTELDVSNNTVLEELNVMDNQLMYLDLNNNTLLNKVFIINNPYAEKLYVYKKKKVVVGNNVKVPSEFGWNVPIWTSNDIDIATVDNNGLVTASDIGSVEIIGISKKDTTHGYTKYYETTSTINVVEITSDKYEIDEDNNYIFVDSDSDIDTIKNNISVSDSDVTIDVDIDNYKLYVKYNDEVLKEFDIIRFSSEEYDLSKDYIYIGNDELDLDMINNVNCTEEVVDNKLLIKLSDKIVKKYNLISISSLEYDLNKEYIYVGNDELNTENIVVTNGVSLSIDDNNLIIKYNEEVLDEYLISSISSEKYDLSKEYIYVGDGIELDNIDNINCNLEVSDDKLMVKYGEDILYEYVLISISINNYNVYGNSIVILEEVSYEEFISNIEVSDNITYKLFNGEEEVTSGNVLVDYILKIYYNDIEIDEYIITDKNEYLEFDDSLDIKDDSIINNIKDGTVIDDITSKINTSGNISILDKNDNVVEDSSKNIGTGYKFKIELPSQSVIYIASVRGDVTGDGLVNINDIIQVSKHVIKGNVLSGNEYINASDIDSNDTVNINDVIRLAKHIVNKSEL